MKHCSSKKAKLRQSTFEKWKGLLPLCPHRQDLGSWLRGPDSAFHFSCCGCTLAGRDSNFGGVVKLATLQKHAKTDAHLSAVAQVCQCSACVDGAASVRSRLSAPSKDDFREVLDQRLKGGAFTRIDGIGCRPKLKRMQFCLAEAARMRHRLFLETAQSVCFHVDSRASRFTVRFSASGEMLSRKGFIGHTDYIALKQMECDESRAYAEATRLCLRRFCTSMPGTPMEHFDASLFQHISSHTDLLNADGAPSAQLSNQILTNALGDRASTDFPRAIVGIDLTHAMRRVVSRPFDKAEGVKSVVEALVLDSGSMVQRTRHSAEMRAMLREHVGNMLDFKPSNLIDSLSNAKHRFDSLLRPLARLCLCFEGMVAHADGVQCVRWGQEESCDALPVSHRAG